MKREYSVGVPVVFCVLLYSAESDKIQVKIRHE